MAVLIKSRTKRHQKLMDVYLCQRDASSGCYNFIGGKRRGRENHEDTAKRKIFDELGLLQTFDELGSPYTYKLEPLAMGDEGTHLVTLKISNETGVLTRYKFHFYRASRIMERVEPRDANKWFTEQELLSGKGERGEDIMTHKEVIGILRSGLNRTMYPRGLMDVEPSISLASELHATPRRKPIEWLVDNRELLAIVAALLSILVAVLKLMGLI